MMDNSSITFALENRDWQGVPTSLLMWVTAYQDCAVMVEVEAHVAQRLRGERADVWPTWDQLRPRLGPVGQIIFPNMVECAITAIEADAGHRMARLAVRVIGLARTGMLPPDQAALLMALDEPQALTPAGDHFHLLYEVPALGRFRLVADPASPIPNFDDPARMKFRSKAAGTPPAAEPLIWARRFIEIQVPPTR